MNGQVKYFKYYFDPPGEWVYSYFLDCCEEMPARTAHTLSYTVSDDNDVLCEPDISEHTRVDLLKKIAKIATRIIGSEDIEFLRDGGEAIHVYADVLKEMGSREKVWIYYDEL